MRVKELWDDYLTEARNDFGYRIIRDDAPKEIKKLYDDYLFKIKSLIDSGIPIPK